MSSRRSNVNVSPNNASVPVPVRSFRCSPCSSIFRIRFRYCCSPSILSLYVSYTNDVSSVIVSIDVAAELFEVVDDDTIDDVVDDVFVSNVCTDGSIDE